jgi:transposase
MKAGIFCRLEAAAETAEAVFASITHLRFDPRLSVTQEIVVLSRIAMCPAHRLDDLLPWNWTPKLSAMVAAAA